MTIPYFNGLFTHISLIKYLLHPIRQGLYLKLVLGFFPINFRFLLKIFIRYASLLKYYYFPDKYAIGLFHSQILSLSNNVSMNIEFVDVLLKNY